MGNINGVILDGQPQFEHKPDGAVIVEGREVAHTLQCVHCGKHWVSIKGSGKIRGFCLNCKGVTCGAESCDPCIPFEKKLDIKEGKKYPNKQIYISR